MKRSMSGKTEPRSVFKASALSGLNTAYTLWTELNPVDDQGAQAQWVRYPGSKVTEHLICHGQYFKALHYSCGQVHISINRCHISHFLTVLISHDLGNPKMYCKLQWIQCFSWPPSIIFHLFPTEVKTSIQGCHMNMWTAFLEGTRKPIKGYLAMVCLCQANQVPLRPELRIVSSIKIQRSTPPY